MHVHRLQLHSDRLLDLKAFYADLLGFEMLNSSADALALQCGTTRLEFIPGPAAYYHFAFNIVPDRLHEAAAWLQERGIALLPFEGNSIVPFPNWEAEAVYFHDPAGNIVEFIARRRLPARGAGAFTIQDVLSISEIGIATHAFPQMTATIHEGMHVPKFGNPSEVFCALGDDHGLFIVVDADRKKWIPMMGLALPFPFLAEIEQAEIRWKIEMKESTCEVARI